MAECRMVLIGRDSSIQIGTARLRKDGEKITLDFERYGKQFNITEAYFTEAQAAQLGVELLVKAARAIVDTIAVRQALALVEIAPDVVVHVHPDDVRKLGDVICALRAQAPAPAPAPASAPAPAPAPAPTPAPVGVTAARDRVRSTRSPSPLDPLRRDVVGHADTEPGP